VDSCLERGNHKNSPVSSIPVTFALDGPGALVEVSAISALQLQASGQEESLKVLSAFRMVEDLK